MRDREPSHADPSQADAAFVSCAQGADVSGACGSLPRRSLEDYEDVKPWDTSVDGPASGRHVMLRARFDGEDVVLKVRMRRGT
jgi:hypothetical protein